MFKVRPVLFALFSLALAIHPIAIAQAEPSLTFLTDPVLAGMVDEALMARPELRQVQDLLEAARERAFVTTSWPDPMLSLGLQNDGFAGLQIGKMETSYATIMLEQTVPWPGKLTLRGEVASARIRQWQADLARTRLAMIAEVRRAYLALLLARSIRKLLDEQATLWREAEGLARARYEAGLGLQADVLRAQLETSRLRQSRWAVEAEEQRQLLILNRLRGKPADTAITTPTSLSDYQVPNIPPEAEVITYAEETSPELARAVATQKQADRAVALARRELYPDLTLKAGIMPRGGPLPPMWQAGISFNLPVWAASKQRRGIAATAAESSAERESIEAVRQLLRQRVRERLTLLASLIKSWQLFRAGILVQSRATAESSLVQYRVGNVPFASVLEALAGYLADANAYYDTIAAAQRILIQIEETSLEPLENMPTLAMPRESSTEMATEM